MLMNKYMTEQESFWAGEFGSAYVQRNQGDDLIAAKVSMFNRALSAAGPMRSCLELGANIGLNLRALKILFPGLLLHAVEINEQAVEQLSNVIPRGHITHGSILEHVCSVQFDLVLIKGVLIHINPDALPLVYQKLYESTGRYLLLAEYFSPTPVGISYRGHDDRLFKRDFCGEILDRYPDLKLLDYGFAYSRDPKFDHDDSCWFLLEKAAVGTAGHGLTV
jgi:spore coat polysaccharide biosynthesis protein SpsF